MRRPTRRHRVFKSSRKERPGSPRIGFACCLRCYRLIVFAGGVGWYASVAERQYLRERFADLDLEPPASSASKRASSSGKRLPGAGGVTGGKEGRMISA
jgi:hypothetical protein